MYLLGVVLVFYLLNSSFSLSYDDLANDECFKKIYVCGDHRVSITGGTGRLLTEPYRFGEVCRKHKEFIACIEDASRFCADNFTDLSLMILDNRRSVKMFCTDLEWKKNYFQSAACINRREQEVKDKCRIEENERVDDRPWWCLIPEPCEAIQRVFHCTVRKMEERCGYIAAEVFRRIHLLKVENQDVVCEFRLRNPRYCHYQRATKAPDFEENYLNKAFIRRIGSMKPSTSETTINLSDTIVDSVKLLEKMKLLSLKFQDTETFVLKNLLSINGKLKKLLTNFYLARESFIPSYSKDFADEKSSTYKTENYDRTRMHFIKDSIFKLHELFNDKDLNLISDDHVELSWKNLKEFPIEHMSCFWLKSSPNTFKCNIKVLSLKQEDKIVTNVDYDLYKQLSDVSSEDSEDLLDFPEFESSSIDDSEESKTSDNFKETEMEPLVFISIDDSIFISNLNLSDIHRSGFQVDDLDRKSVDDNWGNDKLKSSDLILDSLKQVKFAFLIRNAKDNFMTESNENSKRFNIKSTLKHFEEKPNPCLKRNKSSKYNFPATCNLEEFSEYKNEDLQLRKLEEILHDRFQDIVSYAEDSKQSEKLFCEELNEKVNDSCPSVDLENICDAKHD